MSELPEIKFGLAGLSNWDEINRWAMCNDVLWRETQMQGRHLLWNETDTLRVLCAGLLFVKIKSEKL